MDLDAELTPETTILEAAHHVAVAFTWQEDWLNSAAVHFLPSGFGERTAEWSVLHEQNGIVVEVATAETLLAMKLFACQRRRRRELPDLRVLLPLCGIATIDDAEKHLGMYYPGEEFTLAAAAVVQAALDDPAIPQTAEPPVLA
ncbi:hypothetical protein [uncultured Microbacterium sp.]|uniref:hypothetical protein n=1 Tax=uncultured Microbacterium sp. TaxID=191216 RepID=UPI0026157B40|nr:hypothetical protein [uncultured Microbacterium sp.]